MLPLLLWGSWSAIQQEPKLLYHTGNCLLCGFSSTCLSVICLELRQLLFSPSHPRFTQALQYFGDRTSGFEDKQRNVPLCISSSEQGLRGEGLPFSSNMFLELLQSLGRAVWDLRFAATSVHVCFYPGLQDQEEHLAWEQQLPCQESTTRCL